MIAAYSSILACCLFPFFVITVKAMVSGPAPDPSSSSSSFPSARLLRTFVGTAESQRARAVFLSTLRDSAEVSVTSLASSFANSASASSEGPRLSWRLLLAERTTSWSGEGARSSVWFATSATCMPRKGGAYRRSPISWVFLVLIVTIFFFSTLSLIFTIISFIITYHNEP